MKLRSKIKISFLVMMILPVVMCMGVFTVLLDYQTRSIMEYYQVEGEFLDDLYMPISLLGKMTNSVYNEMKETALDDPMKFTEEDYLNELSGKLSERLSSLIVRKNGIIIYSSSELSNQKLYDMLPKYGNMQNNSDVGSYRGENQCLIKQIDFSDKYLSYYSVSIVTSLQQVIPQVKLLVIEGAIAVIMILFFTSSILNIWIYSSVIRPLDRLKLATHNIKEGNLDFELPIEGNNEIDQVCRDFEEMRVILKNSTDEKMQSDVEEKELIRNISHDLKTPLTAIKGYVEGLMDGVADTEEKREKYLRTIFNKVSDMDKLIDELTIYSRIDTNRIPYEFKKINVTDYFDDCISDLEVELEAIGFSLAFESHVPQDSMMIADAEQLNRVINNIISNSVKYASRDRKGSIKIEIHEEENYIHIIIADNGQGINKENLPHIFERFYRADSSRNSKQGGSGIGLAIVKKIVEDHNGIIWADSVEQEGTTIYLNLRKYKEDDNNEQSIDYRR